MSFSKRSWYSHPHHSEALKAKTASCSARIFLFCTASSPLVAITYWRLPGCWSKEGRWLGPSPPSCRTRQYTLSAKWPAQNRKRQLQGWGWRLHYTEAIKIMPQEGLGPDQVTIPRQGSWRTERTKVHTQDREGVPLARTQGLCRGTEVGDVTQGERPAHPFRGSLRQWGAPAGSELRVSKACPPFHLYGADSYTHVSHSCVLKG